MPLRPIFPLATHLTRLPLMASQLTPPSSSQVHTSSAEPASSLSALHRTNTLTSRLAPDPKYPTPQSSHSAPRGDLLPRLVRGGFFTYVRPTKVSDPELLATSPAALKDLGISEETVKGDEFLQLVSGNCILGWEDSADGGEESDGASGEDESGDESPSDDAANSKQAAAVQQSGGKIYPWAQNYGGFQFGSWAGQLGDGRAISLFEITHPPASGLRHELQLKGAGRTPYSRFADGRAVLRASIREFLVSEALHALAIPTTRALSLVLAEKTRVQRERVEPAAIVARFAPSWIRLGTFDLLRARGDRAMVRQLADYVADEVLGGWEALAAPLKAKDEVSGVAEAAQGLGLDDSPHAHLTASQLRSPGSGVARDTTTGSGAAAQNRYARLYRTVVRLNAATVAQWQTYGFTNGVLNTDNTSVAGLSLDFGPFSFLDAYDPSFTPNHDDHSLRYSYGNQPSVVWWNLVRFGEALGEWIGAGPRVDDARVVESGFLEGEVHEVQERAGRVIGDAGEEYRAIVRAEFCAGLARRLGFKEVASLDFSDVFTPWLDILKDGELDFNHSFRRIGAVRLAELETGELRLRTAAAFIDANAGSGPILVGAEELQKRLAAWFETYRARVVQDWGQGKDEERKASMDAVNPKFLPRNWILDEVIQRVEKKGEREILSQVLTMALSPFKEGWGGNKEEEDRFCGNVPAYKGGMQCSCSS